MAKDPAFLFYSQDFIVGVQTMTLEDRGKYITLLAQMHQQGRMDEDTISFLIGSISDNLKKKFIIDENGLWYNKRLEEEVKKRKIFTESRRINGKKGGRPKTIKKPSGLSKEIHMANHMGNAIEDEIVIKNKDDIKDVNENKEIILPWDSTEFIQQWNEWKSYRLKEHQFQYKSPQSEQAALSELARLSEGLEEMAIQIIHRTMSKGWKGLEHGLKSITDEKQQNKSGKVTGAERILRKYQQERI